jgi:hypothetical protein
VAVDQLGGTADDEAIEGACADRTQTFCTGRKDVGQQLGLVPATFKPTVVTLTVGADDIDFSACIATLLASDQLNLDDPANPCTSDGKAARNLPKSLAAFKTGLAGDLDAIERKYPGVPIKIMDYYNPFAPPAAVGGSPCTMSEGLVVGRTYKQGDLSRWLPVVEMVLFHHPKFVRPPRPVIRQKNQDYPERPAAPPLRLSANPFHRQRRSSRAGPGRTRVS